MMSGLTDWTTGDDGIPFDTSIAIKWSHHTARQNLFSLVVQDPMSQEIANVLGDAKPTTGAFFGRRPTGFIVKTQNGLVELELEPRGNVSGDTSAELAGCHAIREVLVREDAVDLAEAFCGMEPGRVRSASAVQKDTDVVLDVKDGSGFNRVLLF